MNRRPSLAELSAFAAIVRHASFRAAADEIGLSASSLSHMMRALEERLGIRLFHRTTRSVAPTEAGARLFRSLAPVLGELEVVLTEIGAMSGRPSGRLRINASEIAAVILMQRVIPLFVERFPDIDLDVVTEGKLVDIVAEGFDAGVRLAEALPQDMVAVAFGGDAQFIVVASPGYLKAHGEPQSPDDLGAHRCIRFRLPSGKMYRWEFTRHDQSMRFDVTGSLTLDHMSLMVGAAIQGLGLAYVAIDAARAGIQAGVLVPVMTAWTPPFPGHHLYYPSSRLVPTALRAFIDIVREVELERAHAET